MKVLSYLCLLAMAATAFCQGTEKTPSKAAPNQTAPDKALVLEVTVPASRAAVWQAFTTSEGLSTWLTPGAIVDLRPGGEWTAHFPGGSTGGGTIVSFVPQQESFLSALAPDRFPTGRTQRTTARFHVETK